MGAGIAAVVNYIANDRFVFHRTGASLAPVLAATPLTRFPHVGIVIPVRNSQRTIRQCIESVLSQHYPGNFDIFLVGNAPEEDTTWSGLGELTGHPALHCLQVDRPHGWVGRDANLKRYCGCREACATGNIDVIAFLDSQVTVPQDWLIQATTLLPKSQADGVAGRSHRPDGDRSFSSLYQDTSLFSEWPSYGINGFRLDRGSFGSAKGLPITNNLFITKRVWEDIQTHWPLQAAYSWEDFRLVNEVVNAGHTIFCTDAITVERHHAQKFRLAKQFSAGAGAMEFYQDYPDCLYVKRRMQKAGLITTGSLLFLTLLLVALAFGDGFTLFLSGILLLGAFSGLSLISAVKAKSLRGLLFPALDVIHIGLWIIGLAYAAKKNDKSQGTSEQPFANSLLALR